MSELSARSDREAVVVPAARVALATASVYPESTASAFEIAAGLAGSEVDAAWLLRSLRAARGEGDPPEDGSEEGLSPFAGR